MQTLWRVLRWLLIAWGGLCLVGAIVLLGLYRGRTATFLNVDTANAAAEQDVRFVLNWCRLGDDRIEELLHSHRSAPSITGDHLDAYAIRISHVDSAELLPDKFGSGWRRCDEVTGVLKDAVDFASGWLHGDEINWFLSAEELRSDEVFVFPWSIYCNGTIPSSVQLIFVRPKDRMVFYISAAS
jgi:hypothetical protein